MNGKAVVLPSSNIVLGTWNTTARTFTALTGSSQSQANACQVTVSLTSAGGNPVNMFFAPAIGVKTANVTASAIAGAGRWDVVVACDITSSFNDDLSQAVAGMQTILSDLNQYSPTSNLGIVTFNGQGWTNASLQPVGTNYAALKTAIGNIKDCASGGPACSGSDLARDGDGHIAFRAPPPISPPWARAKPSSLSAMARQISARDALTKSLATTRTTPWRRRRQTMPGPPKVFPSTRCCTTMAATMRRISAQCRALIQGTGAVLQNQVPLN